MAAEFATPETIAFFLQHTSGVICATLTSNRARGLALTPMVQQNTESQRTAFLVTVDYRHGTTTGISAADRAATIRALVDPTTRPDDLLRPGHIFPLEAREGGVLSAAGHTEASIDLARLAGCAPAGVLCEIVSEGKHDMARRPELELLRPPWAAVDLDRRPDPLPPTHREARPAGRHRPAADGVGRLRVRRLRVGARRQPAHRPRPRRHRLHDRPPRAGAQRVPHGRRVRLRRLPVRAHARRGHATHRRRGHRRAGVPARPRGPGLGVAHTLDGAGAVTTPPSTRRNPPTAGSTASAPRSSPTSVSPTCA